MTPDTGAEWYPARGRFAHGYEQIPDEIARGMERTVFEITPVSIGDLAPELLARYRELGCDATEFYLLRGRPQIVGTHCFACKHEIVIE